jgi:hypothetical protein
MNEREVPVYHTQSLVAPAHLSNFIAEYRSAGTQFKAALGATSTAGAVKLRASNRAFLGGERMLAVRYPLLA